MGFNIKREKNIFKFIDVPFIKNTNSLDIDNISVVTDIPQIQLKDMAWKPKNNIIDKLNRQKEKDVIDVCHVKDVGFNYWSEGRGKKRGNSIGSRVLYDGERKNTKDIPYLKGRDIIKYGYVFGNHWLKSDYDTYLDKKVDTFRFSSEFLEISPKLIYRQTADRIIATVDINKYYLDKTVHLIVPKKDIKLNLLALLGILNSKLMLYVYRNLVREEGRAFAQVKTLYIKKIPLKFNVELENKISEFVKRQLEITKRLNELGDKKTDERIRIEEEIKKTDAEIDELVYKLYGITDSEKRIIEESLK